jgi:hypothetical protein
MNELGGHEAHTEIMRNECKMDISKSNERVGFGLE